MYNKNEFDVAKHLFELNTFYIYRI